MTSLVERLRDRGVCSIAQNSCRNDWVCTEAADTIEAMQAALKRALNYIQNTEGELGITLDCGDAVRAVLERVS